MDTDAMTGVLCLLGAMLCLLGAMLCLLGSL